MQLTRLREFSDAPALTIGGATHSYAELAGMCGAVAGRLRGRRRVAFWAENRLESCVAALAAIETGVEAVALNPKLGSGELAHIVSDSEPEALVAGPADDGAGPLAGMPRIDVDAAARGSLPDAPSDPEAVALIIYTSGTTGPPKGVLMPRRAIASNLDALADAWDWTEADRLVHALPIFHVHGLVLGLVGPLRRGGQVRHLGRFSPEAVAGALAAGDTMLFGVPTMYHRLAQLAEDDPEAARALGRARVLVSGSAALPAATFERIARATGQRVVERYGLTETIMNTAVRADGERRPGEVGRPLAGVEVTVRADEVDGGGEVPTDGETIGEIHVRGPNLFLGYLNRPDATAEVLRDGWFATGDLATRAPDGYLRIVGRRSTDLIKTGGYKVGAGEIESALLEHGGVSEVAVTAAPDEDLGERIVAWVVPADESAPPSERELADHVAATLAPHKRPREVRFLGELPRNAMGKVVKQRLGA
ncbi:MAG TPA: acyl-CoA synthetase [Solirubrobacteraceae bacterium]|nr:acyl-CoA synthetase [Solirubrobacteraceae bacterium]